jgi:hypothetical protein
MTLGRTAHKGVEGQIPRTSQAGLLALVGVAVAQRRLGPSSGHDLHDRPGAAVLCGPAPLVEPAHDHNPTALGQGLGCMLGLVPPDDHGEERRLLLPSTRHGYPEHGPGDPALGVADFRVVGQVAGEARGGLGHGSAPSCCLAGRFALPLDPGDGRRRGMPRDH